MSSVVISGDSSGSVTLTVPAAAGTNTITLPAVSGTVMVNGPAFSAYQSSAQTVSGSTYTKVTFTTEEFDTNSNYNTSTSTFTPTVAGYYQVSFGVGMTSPSNIYCMIYKNGSVFKYGQYITPGYQTNMSTLIQMNGSTDYLEAYVFINTGQALTAGVAATYFQASLVRAA